VSATAIRRTERGGGLAPLAALLVLLAVAWAVTADRMDGMDHGPGTELGGFGWFAVSWLVMMAAMMLPALAPMAVVYDHRARHSGETAAFALGYLAAWLCAGLVGYVAIELVRSLDLGFLAWGDAGRYVAAAAVAGAGLYQLTPWKDAYLRRCRERRRFVREQWRPGAVAGLRAGVEHGRSCVGCSWALMGALFALGVMSLTWMAIVAALIAAERLLPRPARLAVALALVAIGIGVAVAPGDVPALTVPGSEPMHHQMKMMR
jgi:predicted metal-binding membrane protein